MINESGGVNVRNESGVATVSFYHPKSNSLPGVILKQLAQEITAAGSDPTVRIVVLKSEGQGAFCAGASFDELIAIPDFLTGKEFFMGFARIINAIRSCPKFVIARVQGKAVGGGVGLACAADYCLATDNASVKLSELAVGIGPFVVGPAVERKIGTSAFHALAINAAEWRDANWAREKGIYADVFPSTGELDIALSGLCCRLSDSSPDAMKALKKVMWEGTENWDELLEYRAEISGRLILTDFARETVQSMITG
jgi:methylglutaconyl-CoA hydratase